MSDPKKTHPDDMVKLLGDLARSHGYGITEITLVGMAIVGDALPEHRYSSSAFVRKELDGSSTVHLG